MDTRTIDPSKIGVRILLKTEGEVSRHDPPEGSAPRPGYNTTIMCGPSSYRNY